MGELSEQERLQHQLRGLYKIIWPTTVKYNYSHLAHNLDLFAVSSASDIQFHVPTNR